MVSIKKLTLAFRLSLIFMSLVVAASGAFGNILKPAQLSLTRGSKPTLSTIKTKKRGGDQRTASLPRAEVKQAEARLAEMGYGTGRVDGVVDVNTRNAITAFQKWEGLKVNGQLSREDLDAIMNASAPKARDLGNKHVEIDLDRQVLLLTDNDGVVRKILPVSTGSNKEYDVKGLSGLAYTPRGRFRIYAKISGWRKSPLGLLYYPNYFSDGLAIHGNSAVPDSPQSHGCVRIPMSASVEMSRLLPVGTIVLIYDKRSFVSAKEWAEADKQKQDTNR
jgi:peptidoglycan hydrolase-like protein with peptidoglycan-binding domain